MKKHTIKLLTLAFTLAAILTLTGCPGPVNNSPVVPEYTITVNVTHGTAEIVTNGTPAENPAKAKAGDTVTITATAEEGFIFDGASSAFNIPDCSLTSDGTVITWNFSMFTEDVVINVTFKHEHIWEEITTDETKAATCTEDGLAVYKCKTCGAIEERTTNKLGHYWVLENENDDTHKCTNCETTAHHTFIAGGCDKCGAYEHNKEDDYQIKAYVYSSEEDALNDKNKRVLYFSFPNDTTGIPQIVIGKNGPEINIGDLIQMKSGYAGKTVKYFSFQINWFLQDIEEKREYPSESIPLTDLENKDLSNNNSPIYIVV